MRRKLNPLRGMNRPGWTRTRHGTLCKGDKFVEYTHISGAVVQHCGHATALWPWVGSLADGTIPQMATVEGQKLGYSHTPSPVGTSFSPKFGDLADCQEWIEEQQNLQNHTNENQSHTSNR